MLNLYLSVCCVDRDVLETLAVYTFQFYDQAKLQDMARFELGSNNQDFSTVVKGKLLEAADAKVLFVCSCCSLN